MQENTRRLAVSIIDNQAIKCCIDKNLNVVPLNLEHLTNPFNLKFDIVLLHHVLEHIQKDAIIDLLSLIKKDFLVPNGKLLLAVPNAQANTDCYWAYEDWTHTTLFTSGSLYYVLSSAGFNDIEFIDVDCTKGSSLFVTIVRRIFLKIYKVNKNFWNKITGSAYHSPSIDVFSYEIKAKAL